MAAAPPFTIRNGVIDEYPSGIARTAMAILLQCPDHQRSIDLLLDRVDLAPSFDDEVVITLHDLLEFLDLARLPHHLGEFLEALHFHLGHNGPVALRADVGHDAHGPKPHLPADLVD